VTGQLRAIKVLQQEYAADPALVSRFVRERTALLRLRHPNVVTLYDMVVEGECLALVMDLIADGDLAAYQHRRGGRLAPGEACELTAQICDALATAHAAGIVHRDLKPANVLLDAGQVRLADFGIAKIVGLGETPLTASGMLMGTAHYVAPEMIRGQQPSAACDVYAAGVTLYELLAGEPPFTGHFATIMYGHLQVTPERPAAVPDRLWELIAACLSKEPQARPSAANLAGALRNLGLPNDFSPPIAATVPDPFLAAPRGPLAPPSAGEPIPPLAETSAPESATVSAGLPARGGSSGRPARPSRRSGRAHAGACRSAPAVETRRDPNRTGSGGARHRRDRRGPDKPRGVRVYARRREAAWRADEPAVNGRGVDRADEPAVNGRGVDRRADRPSRAGAARRRYSAVVDPASQQGRDDLLSRVRQRRHRPGHHLQPCREQRARR
jgi:serine/threonine protein kinase